MANSGLEERKKELEYYKRQVIVIEEEIAKLEQDASAIKKQTELQDEAKQAAMKLVCTLGQAVLRGRINKYDYVETHEKGAYFYRNEITENESIRIFDLDSGEWEIKRTNQRL